MQTQHGFTEAGGRQKRSTQESEPTVAQVLSEGGFTPTYFVINK